MDKNEKKEIQEAFDKARYAEELYYTVKNDAGKRIIKEIIYEINELKIMQHNIGTTQLQPPDFKFPEEKIRELELLSAKINALEALESKLEPVYLKRKFKQYQEEAEQLQQGLSLEPSYAEAVDPIS